MTLCYTVIKKRIWHPNSYLCLEKTTTTFVIPDLLLRSFHPDFLEKYTPVEITNSPGIPFHLVGFVTIIHFCASNDIFLLREKHLIVLIIDTLIGERCKTLGAGKSVFFFKQDQKLFDCNLFSVFFSLKTSSFHPD